MITNFKIFENINNYETIIYSKSFKKWFGDWEKHPENSSKIVDEKGKPLIVYHGTLHGGFEIFNMGKISDDEFSDLYGADIRSGADPTAFIGSHFSKEIEVASKFLEPIYRHRGDNKQLYKLFLNIRNPLKISEIKMNNEILEQSAKDDFTVDREHEYCEEFYNIDSDEFEKKYNYPYFRKTVHENILGQEHSDAIHLANVLGTLYKDSLIKKGYDGVIYKNIKEGGTSFICFYENQIKSAENNITFNIKNPNIYK